jgi:hypothetical protein
MKSVQKTKSTGRRKTTNKKPPSLYQTVICNECRKDFKASTERVKRGGAKFCSRTCSGRYAANQKVMRVKTCKYCSKNFKTKNKNAKYCSTKCSNKNTAQKRKLTDSQKEKVKIIKERGCEICKWHRASCDIHHIIPISKGGSNNLSNLVTLCPNHHRMADQDIIPIKRLKLIIRKRKKEIGF